MLSFVQAKKMDRTRLDFHAKKLRVHFRRVILVTLLFYVISAANLNVRFPLKPHRNLQAGGRISRGAMVPNAGETNLQQRNGTAEEPDEEEEEEMKIIYEIVPLIETSKNFFNSLLAALVNDTTTWSSITLPTYTTDTIIPQVANVFASLIVYVVGQGPSFFHAKYSSLGYMLPMRMDASALIVKNAVLGTVWPNVSSYVNNLLVAEQEKSPDNDDMMQAVSLWEMVSALRNITHYDRRDDIKSLDQLTIEEQTNYLTSVRSYFRASCELAWFRQNNFTILEKINLVQLAGKYVNSTQTQPPNWYVPLISNVPDRTLQEYPNVLVEMALLKFATVDVIRNASGQELMGSVIDPYFDIIKSQASDMIRQSDDLILAFFGDSDQDIPAYMNVSSALCKPELLIRFCFLSPMLQQMSLMASHKDLITIPGRVTVLSQESTDMKRSRYLTLLKERSEAQQKALAITDLFAQLNDSIQTAGNDITAQKHSAAYGEILTFTQLATTRMAQIASQARLLGNGMAFGNDRRFNASMLAIGKLLSEIKPVVVPYIARLETIGKAAQKAMQQKQIFGIFGLVIRSLLHVMEPDNWFKPAAYADFTRAINQVRKDFAGEKGVKELNKLMSQGLIPKLISTIQGMLDEAPKLQNLRFTIKPLQNYTALTPESFVQYSQNFLRAYGEYNSAFTSAAVTEMQEIFSGYQGELCRVSNAIGLVIKECLAVKEDVLIFAKLQRVISTSNDAITTLAEVARGAVTAASANFFIKGMNAVLDSADAGFDKLTDKWRTGRKNRLQAYQKSQQRTKFLRVGAIYQLLVTSTEMFLTAATTCSYLTYQNGGSVIEPCAPIVLDSSTPFDLASLIAYKFNDVSEPIQRIAYIPTSSSSGLPHLPLGDLMATDTQRNITFTIPQNVEWLRRYNWVPADFDIRKHVIFVKRMAIVLPPSTLQPGSNSLIQVTATAHQVTDLGPAANNQKFSIPTRTFDFTYREVQKRQTYSFNSIQSNGPRNLQRSSASNCPNPIRSLYQQCDAQAPDLCAITNGHADVNDDTLAGEVPLPSLFSTFTVSTRISGGIGQSDRIPYTGVQASAPLMVLVSLIVHDAAANTSVDPSEGTADGTQGGGQMAPVEGSQRGTDSQSEGTAPESATGAPVSVQPRGPAPTPHVPVKPSSARQLATDALRSVGAGRRKRIAGNMQATEARKLDSTSDEENGEDTGVFLKEPAAPEYVSPVMTGGKDAGSRTSTKAGNNGQQRCCPKGSYLVGWETQECRSCPSLHLSRIRGIYCVPSNRAPPR